MARFTLALGLLLAAANARLTTVSASIPEISI